MNVDYDLFLLKVMTGLTVQIIHMLLSLKEIFKVTIQ